MHSVRHHRASPGFTLLEIIVVMLIIGLASGLAGIMIGRGGGNRELKILTKDVSTVLRYARNRAVTEKKIYCFVIDKEEHTYWLYSEDSDYRNVKTVLTRPIPEDMQISINDDDEESPHIEFSPRGSSSGGKIDIMNDRGTVVSLRINRITGKVEVEEAE